jgi:hypothetical protein
VRKIRNSHLLQADVGNELAQFLMGALKEIIEKA